jgi:holo-[acyl-carrier protein] synthase
MRNSLSVVIHLPPAPLACSAGCSNVVAVGIDLTHVSEVRESVRVFGDRYLSRVFTARELEDCNSSLDPLPRLAARFAAKEATIKALRVEGPRPEWTSMEVWRSPVGWCEEVYLSGLALRLARNRGIARILVSLSHEDDEAVAVVVATRDAHSQTA